MSVGWESRHWSVWREHGLYDILLPISIWHKATEAAHVNEQPEHLSIGLYQHQMRVKTGVWPQAWPLQVGLALGNEILAASPLRAHPTQWQLLEAHICVTDQYVIVRGHIPSKQFETSARPV